MTPENFAYWLQGFSEICGQTPSEEQWEIIKDHLNLVFNKVTPNRVPPEVNIPQLKNSSGGGTQYCGLSSTTGEELTFFFEKQRLLSELNEPYLSEMFPITLDSHYLKPSGAPIKSFITRSC